MVAVIALAAIIGAYILPSLLSHDMPQTTSSTPMTIIHIPPHSSLPPPNWHNFTDLSSPNFQFPFNTTITIGINNTIEWINDDGVAHTVTSFQVPTGASTFNSDLIFPGKTFSVTLTTPGVYKYFCAWHNWLAGVITVKPA